MADVAIRTERMRLSLELARRAPSAAVRGGARQAREARAQRGAAERSSAGPGDVFVLEEFQGRGLGKRLIAAVRAHPELAGLRRFLLSTRDAHGLYEPFGFKCVAEPRKFMEIKGVP